MDDMSENVRAQVLRKCEAFSFGGLLLALATLHEPFEYMDMDSRETAPLMLYIPPNPMAGTPVYYWNDRAHFLNDNYINKDLAANGGHLELFQLISDLMYKNPQERTGIAGNFLEFYH
jgi:hypothetical protein